MSQITNPILTENNPVPTENTSSVLDQKAVEAKQKRSDTPLESSLSTTATAVANSVLPGSNSNPPIDRSELYCESCQFKGHKAKHCGTHKTTLCPHYAKQKGCRYSQADCNYAHGTDDLRPRPENGQSNSSSKSRVHVFSLGRKNGSAPICAIVTDESANNEATFNPVSSVYTPPSNGVVNPVSTSLVITNPAPTNPVTASNGETTSTLAFSRIINHPPGTRAPPKKEKETKGQCMFVAKGECKAALSGKKCEFAHGFCAVYSSGKTCIRKDTHCNRIHHRFDRAFAQWWEQLLYHGSIIKDPKCVTCRRSDKWLGSRYCKNCAQAPSNRNEFCSRCDQYIWEPNGRCYYCLVADSDKKKRYNNSFHQNNH